MKSVIDLHRVSAGRRTLGTSAAATVGALIVVAAGGVIVTIRRPRTLPAPPRIDRTARPLPARVVPHRPVGATGVPLRYRGVVVRNRPARFPQKIVALTFDDGPDPANTPRILQSLEERNAHATFFVVGSRIGKHGALLRRMIADGDTIGNHSFTHPSAMTEARARDELERTERAITAASGFAPTCFRPPYGITTNRLARLALRERYAVILWTVSSADTRPIDADAIANNVIHTPAPGDIVIMHDGLHHATTADAVPRILDELAIAGFHFVTVPELLTAWSRWGDRHGAQQGLHSRPTNITLPARAIGKSTMARHL